MVFWIKSIMHNLKSNIRDIIRSWNIYASTLRISPVHLYVVFSYKLQWFSKIHLDFRSKMTLQFSVEANPREVWKFLGLATWAVVFHSERNPIVFLFWLFITINDMVRGKKDLNCIMNHHIEGSIAAHTIQ